MSDRLRDRSNLAAVGVLTGLVVASIVSWGTFFWAFVKVL